MPKSDCKMAYKTVYSLSEIRYLWKSRGNKNYEMKRLNTSGNLIHSITFRDIRNHQEVSGKLVALPREGEAYHWPRLKHENLAPLLDIVSINENVSIYITTVLKRSLRDVTCEDGFLRDANGFDRKKSYAEDVLLGLDYLHGKHLCLMNLSEDSIYINERDKAVITDFRSLVLSKRAKKNGVSVPALYRAPELDTTISQESFDALKAEVWACGVMLLQIFTRYAIPATFAVVDINLPEFVEKLDYEILVQANIGSSITLIDFSNFQKFVSLFLRMDPSRRAPVKAAVVNPFLKRNSSKDIELNFAKTERTSPMPENGVKISKFDGMKTPPPSSDAMINREKLKKHSPSNKFINLQYLSNCNAEEENSILEDSLSSNSNNVEKVGLKSAIEKNSFQKVISETIDETINSDKFHPTASTKKSYENINCSYIKIGNGEHNKKSNSIKACNTRKFQTSDYEQSYTIGTKIINPVFNLNSPKYLGIFPNSTFPSLYRSPFRGSLYLNTTLRRSVSSDETKLMEPRDNCVLKPLISGADNVQNHSFSNIKWGYFSYYNDEKAVGEGDRKRSSLKIYKEKYSSSLTNVYSKRKLADIYSLNPVKVSCFDIQETGKPINFAYSDTFESNGTALSDENNRSLSDSKSLVNMEPNTIPSWSNKTVARNNSTKYPHGNTQPGDIKSLQNFNSNFPPRFIKESNCTEGMKEQNDCSRANLDRLHFRQNAINFKSKDFNEQNGIEQQQMSFLNPSYGVHKLKFQKKQAKDVELKANLIEHENKQDDYITPQHLDFHDHIGVFKRNLNSFTEVSLFKEYLEEKLEPEFKKKHRKKSWLRYLCPGCKVYRDDK